MRPHVTCLMQSSIDGRLHPSRFSKSPDGAPKDWSAAYERVHDGLEADAWLVGRVTMAEMSKAEAHAPAAFDPPERPVHVARRGDAWAVSIDLSGKLHFKSDGVGGDAPVVLLGPDVPDAHLAELAADGASYVVSAGPEPDLSAFLEVLHDRFGVRRLALEGGGATNGAFLKAGLVDMLVVLVAPGLDAAPDAPGIVSADGGLADDVRLSLRSVETMDHGLVRLDYDVAPAR